MALPASQVAWKWGGHCPARKRRHAALAVVLLLIAHASNALSADVFPGKLWQTRTPAELRMDSAKLDALAAHAAGSGCVVRSGYLVFTWGDAARRADVASACKPWFTHLLFAAVAEGKLKSVDTPVVQFEPRLAPLNAALDHKDRTITFRQLASQTSCYGVQERPGAAFDYSDFNMALFYDTLLFKVYGTTPERATDEILRTRVTDVIGCEDAPRFSTRGRLAISPRDFARFGLLYLRRGRWNDKQLLPADMIQQIITSPLANAIPRTQGAKSEMIAEQRTLGGGNNQTDHHGSYSLAWWTNGVDRRGQRHWPSAPPDTFAAVGHAGKRAMFVIPGEELIAVWNETTIASREAFDRALHLLLVSVQPPSAAK